METMPKVEYKLRHKPQLKIWHGWAMSVDLTKPSDRLFLKDILLWAVTCIFNIELS